jgi:hypothetical protein
MEVGHILASSRTRGLARFGMRWTSSWNKTSERHLVFQCGPDAHPQKHAKPMPGCMGLPPPRRFMRATMLMRLFRPKEKSGSTTLIYSLRSPRRNRSVPRHGRKPLRSSDKTEIRDAGQEAANGQE